MGTGEPPSGGTTPHVAWLRERPEHSNFILLRIPIEILLSQHGRLEICVDLGGLPEPLGLSDKDIERLRQAGLVQLSPPTP